MAAGFSEWESILGAALAHSWGELGHSESREEWLDIILEKLKDNPMAWDDPEDKVAIELGIGLYRVWPNRVTMEYVMRKIRFFRDMLRTRPYRPYGP